MILVFLALVVAVLVALVVAFIAGMKVEAKRRDREWTQHFLSLMQKG